MEADFAALVLRLALGPMLVTAVTIRLILDMASQAWPEWTALGSRRGGITFGQLAADADADAGAAVLRRLDAGTLAFVGVNSAVVPRLLFAAAEAGIPFAPLNYRLSAAAVRRQLGRLDRAVVVTDAAFADIADDSASSVLTTTQWLDLIASAAPSESAAQEADDALQSCCSPAGRPPSPSAPCSATPTCSRTC
jgi:acyl-CoA synthetase (AMP-forming)/AMP-acid ligase II